MRHFRAPLCGPRLTQTEVARHASLRDPLTLRLRRADREQGHLVHRRSRRTVITGDLGDHPVRALTGSWGGYPFDVLAAIC